MSKYQRYLTDEEIEHSKDRITNHVLSHIDSFIPAPKKRFFTTLTFMITSAVTVFAISFAFGPGLFQSSSSPTTYLNQEASETMATLSYLSSGMLAMESNQSPLSQPLSIHLSLPLDNDPSSTQLNESAEEIAVYYNRFKGFLDDGFDRFDDINATLSNRSEYAQMIAFTMDEDEYTLYFNMENSIISGIMNVGSTEYIISSLNQLEEIGEEKMDFIATHGEDSVSFSYKKESGVTENKMVFILTSSLLGDDITKTFEIKQETNETKVILSDGEDIMEFKKEIEDDSATYRLTYSLDGQSGSANIIEATDSNNHPIYEFHVREGNTNQVIIVNKPII